MNHPNRTLSSWRARMRGAACLLLAAAAGAGAYDLTPDLGAMASILKTNNSYIQFSVWNVGANDWGPTNDCGTIWSAGQWRDEAGKRIGSVANKTTIYQTSMNSLTNGWFTPNPQVTSPSNCGTSVISRGWDDEYGNSMPNPDIISHSIKPTLHARVDPNFVQWNDENFDNNEIWVTTTWNSTDGLFEPMENVYLPYGTTTLTPGDSLFYGAYSTDAANGNIYVDYIPRTTTLIDGNEKIGYSGRRMIVNITSGQTNTYTIQNGSKVRGQFLGQSKYGGYNPP
jgi:hypothetical protein